MSYPLIPYRLYALGDSAITIDFGNRIDEIINQSVLARYQQLKKNPIPGTTELVPAYSTLTIYYNLWTVKKNSKQVCGYNWFKAQLEELLQHPFQEDNFVCRTLNIPVCYDEVCAPDLRAIATQKKISAEQIIQYHTSRPYKVYMLGFLPGFAYMGELDERISMPRKAQPVNIEAGSVGIAGKQTGIYPFDSPGGWQIIGKTPLQLFDKNSVSPVLFQAGDKVRFCPIKPDEYKQLQQNPSLFDIEKKEIGGDEQ